MQLKYSYWYFPSVLSSKLCDDIVAFGEAIQQKKANIGGMPDPILMGKKKLKDLKKTRDSNIAWINEQWVYNEILPYVNKANKEAGWNFEWDWAETCQFTRYTKNQYYDWHCDSWDEPYKDITNKNTYGKIRKLSVTVSLSDEKDYTGGELEFDFRNLDPDKPRKPVKCKEILPKGSLVVFPGFVWHRVCPVKKGTRHSLVMWSLGWPFK